MTLRSTVSSFLIKKMSWLWDCITHYRNVLGPEWDVTNLVQY